MREYYYTIKEMIQVIVEFKRKEKIIAEYKELEGIEIITEEDMTNLFGSTYFNYNLYNNVESYYNWDNWIYISDYEQYLIDSGYNPFKGEYILELPSIDFQIFPSIDTLRPYEIDIGTLWTRYEDWAIDEHLILCMDENNDFYLDYDDYFKEVIDSYYYEVLDFGDLECISGDDILQDIWLVGKIESDNIMDYFWEAEITDLCGEDNAFYTEFRDYFSEHEYDNYSKYLCWQTEFNFYYCKKEDCEGCKHFRKGKSVNPEYRMWEKYVQPLELD